MAFVVKTAKTLRNNWKKTVFFSGVAFYGVCYGSQKYEINQLMRTNCEEAMKYGEITAPLNIAPKRVIVILNPTANKRDSIEQYEEFCEPILHLAGFTVDVIKTDSEGHARRIVEELKDLPDAILVAGGDGTLSEAVTGLLRRDDGSSCPVGILPVGRTNSIGRNLFFVDDTTVSNLEIAKGLINSAICIVRGKTESRDVMKIEVLPDSGDIPGKPVFAMGSLHWGAFRDAYNIRDKYWYTGSFRKYVTFIFNAFSSKLTWNCDAKVTYTPPCTGCSNCYQKMEKKNPVITSTRWWSKFVPRQKPSGVISGVDYSKIQNEKCTEKVEFEISPSELLLTTNNLEKAPEGVQLEPKMCLQLGRDNIGSFQFISESFNHVSTNKMTSSESIDVRTIEMLPKNVNSESNEVFFSIDNEAYEVKPVKISLIPRAVNIYTL